ncbi:hypothetical protein [Paracraurococcus lichenis]|uniref:Lipoprotein n=1 Tax=Paracraurococcus lichenis TaxID=3064888 RepID=A0ABT9E2E0_9PROT|nr:hypothetical protein [Paracraurococcus sp. LOR1-02]MDO9710333.1 hypothetical protein [Paracraurococcus sp. LOR1-02]
MRIALLSLIAATALVACESRPAPGPSETRGLPQVQNPYTPGAGGVAPLDRPPGSRGGDKGS